MDQTPDHDATLREQPKTLSEDAGHITPRDPAATLRYTAPGAEPTEAFGLRTFRGWPILEQLPTKGAEADIYIVLVGDQRRVLKLYRPASNPSWKF